MNFAIVVFACQSIQFKGCRQCSEAPCGELTLPMNQVVTLLQLFAGRRRGQCAFRHHGL